MRTVMTRPRHPVVTIGGDEHRGPRLSPRTTGVFVSFVDEPTILPRLRNRKNSTDPDSDLETMMKYACLVYHDANKAADLPEEEQLAAIITECEAAGAWK